MMDYFCRPELAGNNTVRTTRAVLRGNLRRYDADGVSVVPYFPGASVGQTLLVSIDGGAPVSIALTDTNAAGSSLAVALSDINTALNGLVPSAEAFDSDGTISIRSGTATGGASIQITGGTAATALGFNVALGPLRSVLGEVPSTPEGRLGNSFGTSFPNRGESLTVESVSRSLARITANSDVLYAEHMRGDVLPRKTTFTGSQLLTVPSATRVFTGKGFLSNTSEKEELACYFFLIDPVTQLPPASRVVGVVRGTPSPVLPISNATTWTGGTATGNVLGQDLVKSSLAITSINNGKVIECVGAAFLTTALVVPGDYVEITGATNTTPWSNNGYRWVVDAVISGTTLSVRPMSSSELAQFGPTTTEEQPILELNGSGGGALGTCIVRTGTFCNDAKLVVDPPIPVGAAYDLYVATPGDLRGRKVHESQAKEVLNHFMASDLRPEPNALLIAPYNLSLTGSAAAFSEGTARFSGRVVDIPATTFAVVDVSTGTNYVYWDQDTNTLKTTLSPVKVLNSDPTQSPGSGFPADTQAPQHLVATLVVVGGAFTSTMPIGRVLAEEAESRVITVGVGGQCATLNEALRFVETWAAGNGYRATTYTQFEIVVVSDLDVYSGSASLNINTSIKIRGARPDVTLSFYNFSSLPCFILGTVGGGTFLFEDMKWLFRDSSYASAVDMVVGSAGSKVFFKNVTICSQSTSRIRSFASSVGNSFVFRDCTVTDIVQNLISAGSAGTEIVIENSNIGMSSSYHGVTPSLFGSADPAAFLCHSLMVRGCIFSNLNSDQFYAGKALIGRFGTGITVFDGCTFSSNGGLSAKDTCLFKVTSSSGGQLTISNCTSILATRVFVDSPYAEYCTIENCTIEVLPDESTGVPGTSNPGIRAATVCNNTISMGNASIGVTIIEAISSITGNCINCSSNAIAYAIQTSESILGTNISVNVIKVSYGIGVNVKTASAKSNISENIFNVYRGAGVKTLSTVVDAQIAVISNHFEIGGPGISGGSTGIWLAGTASCSVIGNQIRLHTADGGYNQVGINVGSAAASSVIGNRITEVAGEARTNTGLVGIQLGVNATVLSNSVWFTGNYTALQVIASTNCRISDNYLVSGGTALSYPSGTTAVDAGIVSGNSLQGVGSAVSLAACSSFLNNYVDGLFTTPAVSLTREIAGNRFTVGASISGGPSHGFRVHDNLFESTFTFSGGDYLELRNNVFEDDITGTIGLYLLCEDNVFTDGDWDFSTVSAGGSSLVRGNEFGGTGTLTVRAPTYIQVSVNRIAVTGGGTVTVTNAVNTTTTIFKDNYCTCSMSIGSGGVLEQVHVDGNVFEGSTVAALSVASLNGNRFQCTAVTAVGLIVDVGTAPAPAMGNTVVVSNSSTFTGLLLSGLRYVSTAGSSTFSNCQISGSYIESKTRTLVFDSCQISGSRLNAGQFTLTDCSISGSYLEARLLPSTSTDCCISGSYLHGAFSYIFIDCQISSSQVFNDVSLLFTTSSLSSCDFGTTPEIAVTDVSVVGCTSSAVSWLAVTVETGSFFVSEFNITNGLAVYFNASGSRLEMKMSTCRIGGNFVLSDVGMAGLSYYANVSVVNTFIHADVYAALSISDAYFSDCYGLIGRWSNVTASHISMVRCTADYANPTSLTSIINGSSSVEIDSCWFGGPLSLVGAAIHQNVLNSTIKGGLNFANTFSPSAEEYGTIRVDGNYILVNENTNGVEFQYYTVSNKLRIIIVNNFIHVRRWHDITVMASCIHFQQNTTVHGVQIIGNTLILGAGATMPVGILPGTYTYGVIHFDAPGTGYNCVISSNNIYTERALTGYDFGAIHIRYKYLYVAYAMGVVGAGNIMTSINSNFGPEPGPPRGEVFSAMSGFLFVVPT